MKEDLLRYGRLMRERGFIKDAQGNLSAFAPGGTVYVTPTGLDKGDLRLSDVVEVGLHGRVSSGIRLPSSDLDIHLGAYRAGPSLRAVIHAHSPRAVRIARKEEPLPSCAVWAEDDEAVVRALPKSGCVILADHGAYCAARDLAGAFRRLECLERGAGQAPLSEAARRACPG